MKVALVHNWPGAKNSEFDLIKRIQIVLNKIGVVSVIIDPLGNVLGEDTNRTGHSIDEEELPDLIINLHYTNPCFFNSISYVVNWNPVAFLFLDPALGTPLGSKQIAYYVDCLRSHDRVLSAGSAQLDAYQTIARKSLEKNCFEDATLTLHTTISSENPLMELDKISAENAKVFYVGINWEKLSTKQETKIRHAGLFELLGESGEFKFFGLEELYGVKLWEGIKSYYGELPFDGGQSLVDEAARCGISLILSSDAHRESGLVSTRIFQACKAGSVVISDRNPFIVKHFGDSVYYFNENRNPEDVAKDILEQVRIIKANWSDACVKAKKAQQIFIEKFSLEKEIIALCNQGKKDVKVIDKLVNQYISSTVYVLCYIKRYNEAQLEEFKTNITCQVGCSIKVIVGCDSHLKGQLRTFFQHKDVEFQCEFVEVPSGYSQGYLLSYLCRENIFSNNSFFLMYSFGFKWHSDHLFQLLSANNNGVGFKIISSPLFIDYKSLRADGRELMPFFIEGLDGGYKQFGFDQIQCFNWSDYPTGNLLIDTGLLGFFADDSSELELCSYLGPASVYTLLLFATLNTACNIVNLSKITSRFLVDNEEFVRKEYDEYTYGENRDIEQLKLDRSLLFAFLRHYPSVNLSHIDHQNMIWDTTKISAQGMYGQRNRSYYKEILSHLTESTGSFNEKESCAKKIALKLKKHRVIYKLAQKAYHSLIK